MYINTIITIITIICGITFGYTFLRYFNMYEYRGPDSSIVKKYIYETPKNEYYKFTTKVCICPLNII